MLFPPLSFILHSRKADHEASLHSNFITIISSWKPSCHLDFQKLVGREEPLCIGKKININCSYTRHDCIWETYNPAQTENYVYKHWKKLIFFKQLRDSQYFIIPSFLTLSFSFIATFQGHLQSSAYMWSYKIYLHAALKTRIHHLLAT